MKRAPRRGKPEAKVERPRKKIELTRLQAVSGATPRQTEDSATLLRRMRKEARY
jgi:hypothetical protein